MAAGHAGAVLGAANSVAPRCVDQLKDSEQITGLSVFFLSCRFLTFLHT